MIALAYISIAVFMTGVLASKVDPKDDDAWWVFIAGLFWPIVVLFGLGFGVGYLTNEEDHS